MIMKLNPEQQRQAAMNLRRRAELAQDQEDKKRLLNNANILENLAILQERRAQKARTPGCAR